jgi:hypothetical protein
MKRVKAVAVVLGVVLVAAVAINLAQLKSASGACSINWSYSELDCTVASTGGNFAYPQTTIVGSWQPGSWTLLQWVYPYENIEDNPGPDADPDSVVIPAFKYDEIATTCSGELDVNNQQGISKLNAMDSTYYNCSGSHLVTVKPNGQSCD